MEWTMIAVQPNRPSSHRMKADDAFVFELTFFIIVFAIFFTRFFSIHDSFESPKTKCWEMYSARMVKVPGSLF